jgi:cell division control protein 6
MIEEPRLVINAEMLTDAYLASNFGERDAQLQELLSCIYPAMKRKKPQNAWLFGKPGIGKTLLAKFVLRKIKSECFVDGVYVNCWEHNSYYSVLDKLVSDLRILGAEKLNTAFKLERLKLFVGQRPLVIVLDEIDKLCVKDRDSLIYNLCGIGNVGLVCISNSRLVLHSMDDRILSRLNAKQIELTPYAPAQIVAILRRRAETALSPGSWNGATLARIAELADGDARVAIQTLKNAAYNAESESSGVIDKKHISNAFQSARNVKKAALLEKLTSHHRLLYDLVKEHGEINSGDLWKAYLDDCRALNKPPIALRTFSEYMNKLIELDLVHWDRALVRGKVRVFRAIENYSY